MTSDGEYLDGGRNSRVTLPPDQPFFDKTWQPGEIEPA